MRISYEARQEQERQETRAFINRLSLRLERDERRAKTMSEIKMRLNLENVRQYLPPTEVVIGDHLHLKHLGVEPIRTDSRVIYQGETYCRRHESTDLPWPAERWLTHACKGCEAIASGLAIREAFDFIEVV